MSVDNKFDTSITQLQKKRVSQTPGQDKSSNDLIIDSPKRGCRSLLEHATLIILQK